MKIRIGDKVVEAEMKEVNGKMMPVIKAQAEEIKRPDGRVDVVVKVPCLKIESKEKEV
jgi:hypothetical protein